MCPFEKFKSFFSCVAKGLPIIVTAASIATALIPNPSPETLAVLSTLHNILDTIALKNVGHNASDK